MMIYCGKWGGRSPESDRLPGKELMSISARFEATAGKCFVLFSPIINSSVLSSALSTKKDVSNRRETVSGKKSSLKNVHMEPLAKGSILPKVKEGEDFNRRNTLSILRVKI
ncbi:MAG: hypothetical protein V1736_03535 [Pseudomonadota bacterium]